MQLVVSAPPEAFLIQAHRQEHADESTGLQTSKQSLCSDLLRGFPSLSLSLALESVEEPDPPGLSQTSPQVTEKLTADTLVEPMYWETEAERSAIDLLEEELLDLRGLQEPITDLDPQDGAKTDDAMAIDDAASTNPVGDASTLQSERPFVYQPPSQTEDVTEVKGLHATGRGHGRCAGCPSMVNDDGALGLRKHAFMMTECRHVSPNRSIIKEA